MSYRPSSLPLRPIVISAGLVSTVVGMKELIEATVPWSSSSTKQEGEEARIEGDNADESG
jgi:hypothetical protein